MIRTPVPPEPRKQLSKKHKAEIVEWRSVVGFEERYEVSSDGRLRAIIREIVTPHPRNASVSVTRTLGGYELRSNDNGRGYKTVMLRRDGESHRRYVHRLVLEAFVGPAPSADHQVAHYDGTRDNNRIENLRWATVAENHDDRIRHGRKTGRKRTHCPQGHAYEEGSFYRHVRGYRACKACSSTASHRWWLKRKAAAQITPAMQGGA